MNRNQRLQNLLNISVRHVRQQGKPSKNGGFCAYRNKDGLQCAAAPFITRYEEKMEGDCFGTLANDFPSRLLPDAVKEAKFVGYVLQDAHDTAGLDQPFIAEYHRLLGLYVADFNRECGTTVVIPPLVAMGARTY